MAKGTAICTCETCGKEFEVEKICYNRRDANQWEEWASANYCECSACYRKRMADEARKEAGEMNLPEIVAVSEKQKKFAEDLRAKYVQHNKTFIKHTQEMLDSLDVDGATAEAEKQGKTLDQWLVDAFKAMCLDDYYKILTHTDAREIIELAKR